MLLSQEQFASAQILSIPTNNIFFLGYEDCLLGNYPESEVLRDIVRIVRLVQPTVVITWDMSPRLELVPSEGWNDLGYHPDHQVSGKRALDAVWSASLGRMWPELGPEWKVCELYLPCSHKVFISLFFFLAMSGLFLL